MSGEQPPLGTYARAPLSRSHGSVENMDATGSGLPPRQTESDSPAAVDGERSSSSFVSGAIPNRLHYPEALAELHRWTTEALSAADVPIFGSVQWCGLDDDDPAKTYAAVRAALAWWVDQDRAAAEATEDHVSASHAISAALDWSAVSREPSYQELARRRGA